MERLNVVGYPFCHGAFECCFYLKHFGLISVYMYYQHFRIKSYDDIQMDKNKMNSIREGRGWGGGVGCSYESRQPEGDHQKLKS